MPQLNIYLDAESERLIESAAKRESSSLSRWAREKLLAAAGSPAWPEHYASVVGSISDPSFAPPAEPEAHGDQATAFDP
ncbi:MAG: toxin-antitoxin system, antitoxin component [Chthoniobacterales bacterium]